MYTSCSCHVFFLLFFFLYFNSNLCRVTESVFHSHIVSSKDKSCKSQFNETSKPANMYTKCYLTGRNNLKLAHCSSGSPPGVAGWQLVPCSAARDTVCLIIHRRYIWLWYYLHFYIQFSHLKIAAENAASLVFVEALKPYFYGCLLPRHLFSVSAYIVSLCSVFLCLGFSHWCQVVILWTVVSD